VVWAIVSLGSSFFILVSSFVAMCLPCRRRGVCLLGMVPVSRLVLLRSAFVLLLGQLRKQPRVLRPSATAGLGAESSLVTSLASSLVCFPFCNG